MGVGAERRDGGQTLDSPVVAQSSAPGGGLGSMWLVGLSSRAGQQTPERLSGSPRQSGGKKERGQGRKEPESPEG